MADTEHLVYTKPLDLKFQAPSSLLSCGLGDLGTEGAQEIILVKAKEGGLANQKNIGVVENSQPWVQEEKDSPERAMAGVFQDPCAPAFP